MSVKVLKLVIITDDETAGMITDYADMTVKERERSG